MRFRPGVLFALALATPASAQSPRPTIRAATGAERIRVDGWLDEPAWADAPAAELTQVEPIEGAQPSARTTVRILASAKYLLIGVYAALQPGSGVTAFSKARDAELREEDHIRIVIDPFNDGRSGYLFAVIRWEPASTRRSPIRARARTPIGTHSGTPPRRSPIPAGRSRSGSRSAVCPSRRGPPSGRSTSSAGSRAARKPIAGPRPIRIPSSA